MKRAIFCTVDKDVVRPLVLQLKKERFTNLDISVLIPNVDKPKETDLLPDASKGAIAGGVLGVIAAEFAMLTTLMIPGIGPFVVAGPLVSALAGGTIGSVIGGLSGATGWVSKIIGIPNTAVKLYEEELKQGRGLVMVDYDTPEQRKRAERAFRQMGVTEIHETESGAMTPPNPFPQTKTGT